MQSLTKQLLARAAGNLLDLHARQREGVCGGAEGGRGHHAKGGGGSHHLVDQRGLERPLDAATHQVTQRNLEDMLTSGFT